MTDSGSELRNNNEKIVKLMALLRRQRDEMSFLIEKQKDEKHRIENEIEKLSFKLTLLTKSLGQRTHAKVNYDKTITEIEESYYGLVTESGKLLDVLSKEVHDLEEIMDKKTGTGGATTAKPDKNQETPEHNPHEASKEGKQSHEGNRRSEDRSPPHSKDNSPLHSKDNSPLHSKEEISESQEKIVAELQEKLLSEEPTKIRSSTEKESVPQSPDNESYRGAPIGFQSLMEEKQPSVKRKDKNNKDQSGYKKNPDKPPPIIKGDSSDLELQSYREAYERQHMGSSPPHSVSGGSTMDKTKHVSNSRRGSKRLSS